MLIAVTGILPIVQGQDTSGGAAVIVGESTSLGPKVGEPMPDFTLPNVAHYKSSKASLDDFKGKWLFLDFWFKACKACIAAFPKMNKIQETFKEQLNVVLVGQNGDKNFRGKDIDKFYEQMRQIEGYNLISAYDSMLSQKWGIYAMPHIIIVDPNGKVYARTNGSNLTVEKVRRLIDGDSVLLSIPHAQMEEFEGGIYKDSARANPNLISRSVLYRKLPNQLSLKLTDIDYQFNPYLRKYFKDGERGYKAEGLSLIQLYNAAYFGRAIWFYDSGDTLYEKVYPFPILEIADGLPFDSEVNRYNYSLTVPSSQQNPYYFRRYLQQDLERSFGYSAKIEKRNVPVWILKDNPESVEKIRSRDTSSDLKSMTNYGEYHFRNMRFEEFLRILSYNLPSIKLDWMDKKPSTPLPVVNRTNIPKDILIDLLIKSKLSRTESLNKELAKYGLRVELGDHSYWTLVIRDGR